MDIANIDIVLLVYRFYYGFYSFLRVFVKRHERRNVTQIKLLLFFVMNRSIDTRYCYVIFLIDFLSCSNHT